MRACEAGCVHTPRRPQHEPFALHQTPNTKHQTPPSPNQPAPLSKALFAGFDTDFEDAINLEQYMAGMAVLLHGTEDEKLRFYYYCLCGTEEDKLTIEAIQAISFVLYPREPVCTTQRNHAPHILHSLLTTLLPLPCHYTCPPHTHPTAQVPQQPCASHAEGWRGCTRRPPLP